MAVELDLTQLCLDRVRLKLSWVEAQRPDQ